MKTMKYLYMAALMLGFSATATAQDGSKADVDAVKKIISAKPADLAKQMKPFYGKNKKNAENLTAFARAFYDAKDTANARQYAQYALVASKYKFAPAYVVLGDIEAIGDNGGQAAAQYDQAINADPKLVEAYFKYANVYRKISPRQSIEKLDQLKQNCPDVEINAIKAHIYMLSKDEKKAYEAYKLCDINKLDRGNLNEFARASYFTGHFEDALKACEAGLKIAPRNPTFNRLAMFSNYELKNFEAAKGYVHRYFNETDSAKFSEYDHYYTALIHHALNDKAAAYEQYDKALELVNEESMIKRPDILKTVASSHAEDKNFDKAIEYYQNFLASKKDLTVDDCEGLANLYSKYADADADKKVDLLTKADGVYADIAQKFPIQEAYATYMRANLNNKLDNNMEKALAKPYYQKVAELLGGKADRTNGENIMLRTSYHYLMYNAYLAKNIDQAKEYAAKILEIFPDYKPAQDISNLK